MKKLIEQILKFGLVGIISFFVDFIITMITSNILIRIFNINISKSALIGAFLGFTISVIVNYILSMRYVFQRKDNIDRKKEFIIFVILSTFGLLINELIIYFCIDIIYNNVLWLQSLINETIIIAGAKIIATAVVIIFSSKKTHRLACEMNCLLIFYC